MSSMGMGMAKSPLKSNGSPYRKARVSGASLRGGVAKATPLTPSKKLFSSDILSPLLMPQQPDSPCEGKIREHADRLKMRLQLALYKINTQQTNVSLETLEAAGSVGAVGDLSTASSSSSASILGETPVKISSCKAEPTQTPIRVAPGSLMKGTPASMGAAKSLLQLGNC